MNINSIHADATEDKDDTRPVLVVPYMWIGDFVRGHTVVRVLKQRWPNRPIDLLATALCAPLQRQERRAGAAGGNPAAAGMAGTAAQCSCRGSRALAASEPVGQRSRRGAGSRIGRRLQALDLLSGGRAAVGRTRTGRLGDRRPR